MAVAAAVEALFARAECDGQVCVQSLDGGQAVAVRADQVAVSASVFKVSVALEAETQFADGRLDPRQRITLAAADRTPGTTGFSLFHDDVEVSLRDLVAAMVTISDNTATDALLHCLGIDAVNASSARLGLPSTVITADLRTVINSIGRDVGFADWAQLWARAAEPHSQEEEDRVIRRMLAAAALAPARTTRTTPLDMVRLLRLIWSD
jgi:beta-lactamase class A